jgi:two-component system, NtrC family, sensor kinase
MEIDYGNIVASVGTTAVVIKILTSFLQTETNIPELYKYSKFVWLGLLIFLIVSESMGVFFFTKHYFEILSLLIIYILYKSKEFPNTRPVAITVLPLIFTIFFSDIFKIIVPKFYSNYDDFFKNIKVFASFWLIGFGIYVQRQNKREKIRQQKEELERKILEEKRNSLESQVAERTAELTQQKEALEKTVLELKTTQTQLIHAEKMASLGELTAGIAHEIQNPLNFVNNFSEMSVELIEELKEERRKEKGERDEDLESELLADIVQNLEKITHHGKRASSIVKGMLEHSRTSTGVKELTDINALADEYLRLSYHGLRAKNKNGSTIRFNSDFKTIFDENLPKINVVPQDFGRVLLNLISNAFYAVGKRENEIKEAGDSFKPMVIVSTQKINNQLIIKIKDNGTGMSEAVKAKIFQPFFSTKPTGEGTGLGLSLAYDIVTKGHNGTIDAQSVENEGTEFTITLPIQNN